jgi:LysR family transcriptional regulator, hydrogen peroxide-inducible genes activator
MVSLVQFEYIVAVDTYRHFATAADKCFVTQPTLSMQIKKMEDELGISIFDRTKQPIIPTDVGREIIEQARTILREAKGIEAIVANHRKEIAGELRIGVIPSLAPYLLPLFMNSLASDHPNLHLKVREMITDDIEKALKKDLLDVGILVTPLHNSAIQEEVLFYEEIMVYASAGHIFTEKPAIALKELAAPDLWLLSSGHCFRSQVLNLCSYHDTHRHSLPFEYESGSFETLVKMIDRNGGFTLLPELAIAELDDSRRPRVRTFTDMVPLREVGLAYARSYAKRNLLNTLKEHIQEAVPAHMLSKERGTIIEFR